MLWSISSNSIHALPPFIHHPAGRSCDRRRKLLCQTELPRLASTAGFEPTTDRVPITVGLRPAAAPYLSLIHISCSRSISESSERIRSAIVHST